MKSITTLVLFNLLLALGITSHAQTPDGQTPPVENICDEQVGAAYGLCTAYCEAMDCNIEEPWPSEEACASVKTDFENYTGELLPCDPCFGAMCIPGHVCVNGACQVGEDTDPSGNDTTLPGGGTGGDLGGDTGGGLGGVGGL